MTVRIQDGGLAVEIDTGFGNNAFSMTLHGEELLWTPPGWRTNPSLGGIPLLAPWANRIDGHAYHANGRRFVLNEAAGDLRYDANHLPIHGLLAFAEGWKVVHQSAASVTSRLEFWRVPQWMAHFPFAHSLELTHRIHGGELEVETVVENLSVEPMPLCIGYHPYFQLTDSPRSAWKLHIAARKQVLLSDRLIPTGQTQPFAAADSFPLDGNALDAVFTALTGDDFVLEGRTQRIAVRFGPKFPVAIVYAPVHGSFVCFEPMTALTNAFNLQHAGIDAGLQTIAPGAAWRESFWIKPLT